MSEHPGLLGNGIRNSPGCCLCTKPGFSCSHVVPDCRRLITKKSTEKEIFMGWMEVPPSLKPGRLNPRRKHSGKWELMETEASPD